MKNIIVCFLCLMFEKKIFSQNIKIKEPEFTGVMLLIRDSVSFEKLEKQKAFAGTKTDVGAAIFGVAKGKGLNIVYGSSSPIRIKNGSKVKVIVKVKENDKDPAEIINIFQLEQEKSKDKRVLTVGKVNFNTTTAEIKFIPFEVSRYGLSSYLVVISNLSAGEYAITIEGSRDVFNLFGID